MLQKKLIFGLGVIAVLMMAYSFIRTQIPFFATEKSGISSESQSSQTLIEELRQANIDGLKIREGVWSPPQFETPEGWRVAKLEAFGFSLEYPSEWAFFAPHSLAGDETVPDFAGFCMQPDAQGSCQDFMPYVSRIGDSLIPYLQQIQTEYGREALSGSEYQAAQINGVDAVAVWDVDLSAADDAPGIYLRTPQGIYLLGTPNDASISLPFLSAIRPL